MWFGLAAPATELVTPTPLVPLDVLVVIVAPLLQLEAHEPPWPVELELVGATLMMGRELVVPLSQRMVSELKSDTIHPLSGTSTQEPAFPLMDPVQLPALEPWGGIGFEQLFLHADDIAAPASLHKPTAHTLHDEAPAVELHDPAEQGRHVPIIVPATIVLYLPATQAVHTSLVAPTAELHLPATHAVQLLTTEPPVSELHLPAGQSIAEATLPGPGQYCPAGHSMHER